MNASIHLRTTALQGVPGASAVVRGKVAAGSVAPGAASLASRAEKVAAVAAEHAAAVDRDSRFPAEAIAAARAERLMGIAVPRELGGEGASIGDVVDVCYMLGRACASTAMIYAMHQTKVACLARHGARQRLASAAAAPACATSSCCSPPRPPRAGAAATSATARRRSSARTRRIALERKATVISYGEARRRHCHDGAARARRGEHRSGPRRIPEGRLYARAAHRLGRARHARHLQRAASSSSHAGASEQILPGSYEKIHAQTMMPVAHLTWSGAWAGIAAGGRRSRARLRAQGRAASGRHAAARAPRISRAPTPRCARCAASIAGALQRFEAAPSDAGDAGIGRLPDRR